MKYQTLLVIFALAFISSVLLSINFSCGQDSCDRNPEYDLFNGIANAYIGMGVFFFMILITISQIIKPKKYKRQIIHFGIFIGVIIALYFLYLQQFVLNAYCKYCLVIDIGLLIAFIVAIFQWKK